MEPQTIDQKKMETFLGKAVSDFGSAVSAALVLIGDKLGLHKAMAHGGALTSIELARRTGTTERYVREWLVNQAAGGYVDYDPATGTYSLPNEHAIALSDENSPYLVGGGFQMITAMMKPSRASARRLCQSRECSGASTITICSKGPSDFSIRAARPISWVTGFRRWTA
jgi:hypothetical protein